MSTPASAFAPWFVTIISKLVPATQLLTRTVGIPFVTCVPEYATIPTSTTESASVAVFVTVNVTEVAEAKVEVKQVIKPTSPFAVTPVAVETS